MNTQMSKLAKRWIYRKGKTVALHGFSILEKLHSCINALIESCCPFPNFIKALKKALVLGQALLANCHLNPRGLKKL
jgi:hypothetical protein